MFEEKLQVQMSLLEELQAQAAIFGEDLHILQPVVAKAKVEAEAAKAKAEVAKARAIAEGMADDVIGKLRCTHKQGRSIFLRRIWNLGIESFMAYM